MISSNSLLSPRLDKETVTKNLDEKTPAYSSAQAITEANRCLFCFDAPCIKSCPTGIDIPAFIKKIATENTTGAAREILTANILGASCARVCPTEVLCEGSCVVGDNYEPIQIGRLQRFATDHVADRNISVLPKPTLRSDAKKIAIVGAGPAGLGAAAELAQLGHKVTVFDKNEKGGGLNTYGIAYYKMKPQVSIEEVELVESLGVEMKFNCSVGTDVAAADLVNDYDAVFLGIGMKSGTKLGIPGEDNAAVVDAIEYIADIHTEALESIPVGEHVVVVGGGNTAIDAVVQAKKLGAKTSTLVYRRDDASMPAYRFEKEWAKKNNCHLVFFSAPEEVIQDSNGKITALRCSKTEMQGDRLVSVANSDFEIPCDMVIKAISQQKHSGWLETNFPDLELDSRGVIVADPVTCKTSHAKIYAGGDAINGGREVVNAVGDGKKAAHSIHTALTGEKVQGLWQSTRAGIEGEELPSGSGLLTPVRAIELEAELA